MHILQRQFNLTQVDRINLRLHCEEYNLKKKKKKKEKKRKENAYTLRGKLAYTYKCGSM